MDEQGAYLDSSRRSEQLWCTKFFHPSYGLFYINFQSFIHFEKFNLVRNNVNCYVHPALGTHNCTRGADMWVQGVPVDQSNFDWSTGGGAPLSCTVLLT